MEARFEVRKGKRRLGKRRWYVVLRARNGEVLNTSEQLTSRHAAMENIEATKALAFAAPVVDVS